MTERKKIPEFVETSLAYILATVAAWLAFLLGWLVCSVASRRLRFPSQEGHAKTQWGKDAKKNTFRLRVFATFGSLPETKLLRSRPCHVICGFSVLSRTALQSTDSAG